MSNVSPLLVVLSIAASALAGPAEQVAAATAAVQRVPAELRREMRFLTKPPGYSEKEWKEFQAVLRFQVHSLSREADIVPTPADGDVVMLNMRDFAWDRAVWEKFATLYPYFHFKVVKVDAVIVPVVPAKAEEEAEPEPEPLALEGVQFYREGERDALIEIGRADLQPGTAVWVRRRRGGPIERVAIPERKARPAPRPKPAPEPKQQPAKLKVDDTGKEAEAYAALAVLTDSQVPIVRADWFLWQTGAQFRRGGAGYYDFMGFKNRADIEKFAGLDREAAKRARREMAAIVAESGVAENNRQIVRLQTLTGPWWFSLDTDSNEGKKNAVKNLDGDFQHLAEEIYGPHRIDGLFVYGASDADGKLQEKVPAQFAGDKRSPGNGVEIEPMRSCVACHKEGLRPIDDWARKTFQGPVKLASKDYEKLKRLRQLYLSDLEGKLKADVDAYTACLKKINGLTPKQNSDAYELAWVRYTNTSLGIEQTAAEVYAEPEAWKKALTKWAVYEAGVGRVADPVLSGLLADRPTRIRREHWAEAYSEALGIWKSYGGKP